MEIRKQGLLEVPFRKWGCFLFLLSANLVGYPAPLSNFGFGKNSEITEIYFFSSYTYNVLN